MRRWLLPEAIEDALPFEARHLESLRRRLLDLFGTYGYELVMPPLLEYIESLLTASGRDLDLRTFKLVDQISGRTMGVRADITPQVARIDAHLLNRQGVARLCYCGSVLHTLASGLTATREPLQIGAEIYGHTGLEADAEIVQLLAQALAAAGVATSRLDLGHVGVFKALARRAGLEPELEQELLAALQAKDMPMLREIAAALAEPARSALLALPDCYGGAPALEQAARLIPEDAEIGAALAQLRQLAGRLGDLPVSFDLADLRGYHYHSGVVFAAYCDGYPGPIALGGRYDRVGHAFGRGRPATGFSMDLREVARIVAPPPPPGAILAPDTDDAQLRATVDDLRRQGETVIVALPGHDGTWDETACDRELTRGEGGWSVVARKGG